MKQNYLDAKKYLEENKDVFEIGGVGRDILIDNALKIAAGEKDNDKRKNSIS